MRNIVFHIMAIKTEKVYRKMLQITEEVSLMCFMKKNMHFE